jgi:hypothetical protein
MPAVRDPLINATGHVEQAELIWQKGADWRGFVLVKW